jgi:hypothetical protein
MDRFEEFTRRTVSASHRCSLKAIALAVILFSSAVPQLAAQGAPQPALPDRIRGVVINSVTHEPISRALVLSPDNSFATMTDDHGRFEFTFTPAEPEQAPAIDTGGPQEASRRTTVTRTVALAARKVGFLNRVTPLEISDLNSAQQILTIPLVPEARIVGHVILPSSDVARTKCK